MKYRITLFVILLLASTIPQSVMAYDFYANAPTGQRLYYNIYGSEVTVVHPTNSIDYPYSGYSKPSGNLTIPDSVVYGGTTYLVTSIGERAFKECTGLTSVIIPNSVNTIGELSFQMCRGITMVTMPNSITSIGVAAFVDCSHLTSITIPNSVTSIDSETFAGCERLTSVTIPNSVASIGSYAFSYCTFLASVIIPNSVTSIGDYAFFSCNSLSSMTIPNSVTSIGERVFNECNSLISIIVESDNPIYDSRNSCNAIIETATNKLIVGCMNTTIPNTVTSIGNYAFSFYNSLTIKSLALVVPTLGINSLYNANSITVYIPCGSMASYQSVWGYSLNYIEFSDSYILEVGSNNDTMGTTNITAPPNCINNAVIVATANYGYHFTQWSDGNANNPRTITLTQDTSVIAMFAKNHFSVIGVANDSTKGLVSGSATVEYLDTVTLTATANYGYHFIYWNDYCIENPRKIAATSDITQIAIFVHNQYSLTLQPDTSIHGICNGGGSYNYLSECIIYANANYGYHFTMWNDGDTNNPRVLTLTQDTSFTALFERNYYVISTLPNNPIMGSVNGGDTALFLDNITISATPNYGYHFSSWDDNNTSNPRVVQVTESYTYTALFDYNQYAVTLNVDTNIHGSVAGDGSYNYLSEQTITATAAYGYHFTAWSDGDTNNPRTITLTQDTIFTAQFAKNTYTITAISADTIRGSVIGSTSIEYLDSVTIMANPNYGYHFMAWNDGNTDNPRIIVATRDSVFTASFVYNQYTITLNVDSDIHGSVVGGGSFNYLSEQTIIATANYGYHFTAWSDGETNNPRTITLTQDTGFTALFAKNQYTLTLQSDDVAHGSVIGGGVFDYLDTVAIEATAVEHYHFVLWNDGNTDNPRQYVLIGNDTLIAVFAIDTHHVSVESCNIAFGSVEGSGDFEYGTPATVTATAYSGYQFVRWSNGDTHNPYTFAVLQDTTLVAIFEAETQGIDDVIADAVNVYTLGGQIVVETKLNDEIYIYDIVGRKVDSGHKTRFDVPAAGVYLVKIGTSPTQKVVVVK